MFTAIITLPPLSVLHVIHVIRPATKSKNARRENVGHIVSVLNLKLGLIDQTLLICPWPMVINNKFVPPISPLEILLPPYFSCKNKR